MQIVVETCLCLLQDILLANIGELDDVLDEELEEDERTGAFIL